MAVEEKVQEETSAPELAVADNGTADADTLRQEIALRAYNKYCERGCAPGCDVEDWLAAEREVLAAQTTPAAPSAPAPRDDGGRRPARSHR